MARYDYRCATCGVTYELTRAMADADMPCTCPEGHVGGTRLLPVFAATGSAAAPAPSGGCCGGGGCG